MEFFWGSKKRFSGEAKVVKFHFAHLKLRKRPFLLFINKMLNFKFQGALELLPPSL